MPTAEIITLGTEILLGEITDTNSRDLARAFRENGINVFRITSLGDNPGRIAAEIRAARKRAEIIITTGGLGPTGDDPTREAIAQAFRVALEFQPELWEQVKARFARFDKVPTENNRQQAYIPSGATPIENTVGTAPAFMIESPKDVVICLPGVPREMEHILDSQVLPYLKKRFRLESTLKVRVLHTAGVGESQIDERLRDLETLDNPTVGLAAHAGQVDIRITARARSAEEAVVRLQPMEQEIRRRLGDWIFGADEESLPEVAMRNLRAHGWRLAALEAGIAGALLGQLGRVPEAFLGGMLMPTPPDDPAELLPLTRQLRQTFPAEVLLGVAFYPRQERAMIQLALSTPIRVWTDRFAYGGPPKLAGHRAANLGLNLLRQIEAPRV